MKREKIPIGQFDFELGGKMVVSIKPNTFTATRSLFSRNYRDKLIHLAMCRHFHRKKEGALQCAKKL